MKMQQKVICEVGSHRFTNEVNGHLDNGWRVAQGSMLRGDGDTILCVVEREVSECLPRFAAQRPQN